MADLVNTPQFKVPFDGTYVEQGGSEDAYQNAIMVLRYERGERTAIPDFGISDPALREGGSDPQDVMLAVSRWEPNVDTELAERVLENGIETLGLDVLTFEG